ncbi:heterokaryon incompatibility protein-domain-containing protein [Biscogniauxia mediterranea]|nr:heterokaryon incompatibility protein-domain-containing protein [Biscogniauxia mediterranea]
MTEYDKLYENIVNRPGGPYFRLLTILPKKNDTKAGRAFYEDDKNSVSSSTKAPTATDIELQLSVHPFKGCPKYEALSYCWGDMNGPKYLLKCNGHRFLALRSMTNALLALRLPDRPRTVWIDAICIHQEDVDRAREEKGQQIGMMQHIYRGAARTIVWLGTAKQHNFAPAFSDDYLMTEDLRLFDMTMLLDHFVPSLENLLVYVLGTLSTNPEELWQATQEVQFKLGKHRDLIKLVASRVKKTWNQRHPNQPLAPNLETAIRQVLPSKIPMIPKVLHGTTTEWLTRPKNRQIFLESMTNDSHWKSAVDNLLCREWWSRKWIIQEVCLSTEVVILCGNVSFDLDLIFLSMVLQAAFCSNPVYRGHTPASWSLIQIMTYRRLYQEAGKHALPSFLQVLQEFRCSDATNPLDHIYALLGLAAPDELVKLEREQLIPNYKPEMTFDRCCITTARAIFATSDNLDPLLFVHWGAYKRSTIPTWVPDWSYKPKEIYLAKDILGPLGDTKSKTTFSACGPCRSYPNKFRGDRILVASGYDTDDISEVVSRPMPPMSDLWYMEPLKDEGLPEHWLKDDIRTVDMLFDILVKHGNLVSTFFEWEEFALGRHRSYPTREDIRRVFCAVRCFGYMPEGEELAFQAFNEYSDALSLTRRVYDLVLSPTKSPHPFSKNRASNPRPSPSKIRQALVAIGAIIDGRDKAKMQAFNAMQSLVIGRKLAWTRKGYLALVPDNVQPGDSIVLCRGSKLPLVTRPSGQPNKRELIGACYVHGITRGEAWDVSRCREMEIV